MTCPVCEKRALEEKKAASDCKQEVKQLEAKSVRLTIILTALGTLVGKELLDEAIGLADSVSLLGSAAPLVEDIRVDRQDNDPGDEDRKDKPQQRIEVGHDVSLRGETVLFPYVPPLLVNLETDNRVFLFEEQVVVPSTIQPLLAIALWKPRRRTE